MMRPRSTALFLVTALAWSSAAPPVAGEASPSRPAGLMGFGARAAAAQRAVERSFDQGIRKENIEAWIERLSSRPHHVGSEQGEANARFMAERFRQWGYDTRIETFQVLFPTPRRRVLEMTAPTRHRAKLAEPGIDEDRTSRQTREQLPTYNAFSIDGKVEGELVYVNQGVPADYEELARRGISVEGKIVIARYGGSWRGIKPKVAAEHGAIGCILYSDPRGDGYFAGDPYPEGGFRPGGGVQRGSVLDMPLYPGDPLTPGRGATEDAERLPRSEVPNLTRIPVLPISADDARPFLEQLAGPVAPRSWRGALPLTYHIGPGPARVKLELEFDWKLVPAHDVIAVLPGTERPDQWILRGNHHDAWVNGATDPVSGMVALMEEARLVAAMVKEGWRPRRTVVYAAWDAEEPGLIGSTEWVEQHAAELRQKAVVYLNTDSNSRGFLQAGGSHTLERFVNEVAADVADPHKGASVGERLRARLRLSGNDAQKKIVGEQEIFPLSPLGSGSDYTPFLQHLGIASLNLSFGGEGDYGQYHSIYDSFDHFTRFMDPGFEYSAALVRLNGRAVMRLAAAEVLPFEFSRFVDTVAVYVDELDRLADDMRRQTDESNSLIEDGVHALVARPGDSPRTPLRHEPVPHLDLAPLRNAVASLRRSVQDYRRALDRFGAASGAGETGDPRADLEPALQQRLDAILAQTERALTRREGLPGRSWFRHLVYAPGFYTGYGVKTLPAVREAIEQREWDEVPRQVRVTAQVLAAFDEQIRKATDLLQKSR